VLFIVLLSDGWMAGNIDTHGNVITETKDYMLDNITGKNNFARENVIFDIKIRLYILQKLIKMHVRTVIKELRSTFKSG